MEADPHRVSLETEAPKWVIYGSRDWPSPWGWGLIWETNSHDYWLRLVFRGWKPWSHSLSSFRWQATRRSLSALRCEHWTMWLMAGRRKSQGHSYWKPWKAVDKMPMACLSCAWFTVYLWRWKLPNGYIDSESENIAVLRRSLVLLKIGEE